MPIGVRSNAAEYRSSVARLLSNEIFRTCAMPHTKGTDSGSVLLGGVYFSVPRLATMSSGDYRVGISVCRADKLAFFTDHVSRG